MILGDGTLAVLKLLGGVAVLLWGLRMVRTGAIRALGGRLRRIIGRTTRNSLAAFTCGFGLTALVQSSTAVVLLIASFAAKGMVGVGPGLAMVLGADVGTTLVAQVLSFDLGFLAPLAAIAGFALFSLYEAKGGRNLGRVLLGLSLMLTALSLIVDASAPIRDSLVMRNLIAALGGEPLLAVIIAALLTWLSHSSLAMVLLVMSLALTGSLPIAVAYVLVLGVNLGGTLPAVLATTYGNEINGRRIALGNLLFRAVGVIIALPLLPLIMDMVAAWEAAPARQVANFHTLFNVAIAATFLLFTGPMARLMERLIKAPEVLPGNEEHDKVRYLDPNQVTDTAVALSNATREALRMADVVYDMLDQSLPLFDAGDPRAIKALNDRDDVVDQLDEAIKLYVTDISRERLNDQQSYRCAAVMNFITNLEYIGDIVCNLTDLAASKSKKSLTFSPEGWEDLLDLHADLINNMQLAMNTFLSDDEDLAEQLLSEKRQFKDKVIVAVERHLGRLRDGYSKSLETSSIHLDVLRDFRQINSHITSVAHLTLQSGHFSDGPQHRWPLSL